MRCLILALFLSGSMVGQTPPPDGQSGKTDAPPPATGQKQPDEATAPKFFFSPQTPRMRQFQVNPEIWKKFFKNQKGPATPFVPVSRKRVTVTLKPGQPCAIPLTNVLKFPMSDHMIFPTPPPEKFPILQVVPPAPSCDDVKK